MLTLFFAAFGLGLLFNAAPGPVFAETVRHGARGGYRAALAVQLGSLAGDALWAILGLLGVGLLFRAEAIRLPVGIAGALYLLWLACDSWRESNQVFSIDAGGMSSGRPFRSGVALSITNPQNVAYWAALGSAMSVVGAPTPSAVEYAVFFTGFMASSILWAILCAAGVAWVFRSAGATWMKLTYRLCALAFLALALASLRDLTVSKRDIAPVHGAP